MSNLILFGAGASFGSDTQNTPPLGSDLFDALQRYDPPGWGQIPSELAQEFANDFEVGMTKLAEANSHAMPILQRAMAAYFFNFLPTTNNLYYRLAQRISSENWKGTCASLNYERLLEVSLGAAGVRPIVGRKPDNNRQIELCLPHGSCHIFCESVRAKAGSVSFGPGVTISGQIVVIAAPGEHMQRIQQDAFPPVMSYFEPQKLTASGVNFIQQQRQRWADLVKGASAIAIVGVKVRSRDEHIWKPLAESEARLVYCGGPSAAMAFRRWQQSTRSSANDRILKGYFAEEFENLCHQVGL
ncbi:MAG: hypothetical protein GTO55_08005 [Armatimonadetes bacterium]|nr:hypothetical protein [Armatimonadota bacterium]NIM24202.1 hypothetical protein [Armatimonadota bacterium]NIM68067.1 hypothetical protein [Armatimonadota bacterium]NIN06276.1 hypothetical protein [Armatimonadota bacterium]NIO97801.1 hypothetical protein [Armatimonadota bacterium]